MPRFVPVVDVEKPRAEQDDDPEFRKHKKFDALNQPTSSLTSHRGWQSGTLGWGVLGSFGSVEKDDSAQVMKTAQGQYKLVCIKYNDFYDNHSPLKKVKNDKGLWVRQQEPSIDIVANSGKGRGSGIPVFPASNHSRATNYDDRGDTRYIESSSNRQTSREESKFRDRSREKDYESRKRDNREERYGDNRDRKRERSDSRHRRQSDKRDNHDNRKHDDRRERQEDRRDRSRDRDRSRRDSRDDKRDRETSSRDRIRETTHYDNTSSHSNDLNRKEIEYDDDKEDEKEEEEAIVDFQFTAVQVVNRFHEVYSLATLFHEDRLQSIEELFAVDASICSMKNKAVYLSGKTAIRNSFDKTSAAITAISKRIYVESSQGVSFCFDLHRAGTAPGLGDKTKDTALLYRSENALLTHIWGTSDLEKLSQETELTKEKLLGSKIWNTARQLILLYIPSFNDKEDAHYHNYDHIEVWG